MRRSGMDVEYDPSGFFATAIADKSRADAALLEQAVESALQGGESGVLALHRQDGMLIAAPHVRVPFGQVWHAPAFATSDEGLAYEFATFEPWPDV